MQGVQIDARNELKPSETSATGGRQFLKELDELNLSLASLSFPTRRTYYDLDRLDARIDATKSTMQFAFQLKASVVTARIGRIPTETDSEQYHLLRDVLNDLARHGNHVGATFAIRPTNDSAGALLELVSSITEGPIGINFDPANFVMTGHDPIESFRVLYESIIHVQVRDAIREVDGSGLEVSVGRGEVAWDEFLALLDEAGYSGWLTIERTSGDDKQNDVARAANYLRNVAME